MLWSSYTIQDYKSKKKMNILLCEIFIFHGRWIRQRTLNQFVCWMWCVCCEWKESMGTIELYWTLQHVVGVRIPGTIMSEKDQTTSNTKSFSDRKNESWIYGQRQLSTIMQLCRRTQLLLNVESVHMRLCHNIRRRMSAGMG